MTTPTRPAHGGWYGVAARILGRDCGPLGDSCGRPEPPRRDTHEALEVAGELALVREACARRDLRQGGVAVPLQEPLGPFDAAREDKPIRWQTGGRPELPRKVIRAEAGDG